MKSFGMLKLPMILAGIGAAMLFSPSCKAQEVSNDHFTDSGVQNVYDSAPARQVAAKPELKSAPVQASAHHKTNSPVTLQAAAHRAPVLSAQEVADKRKPAPKTPKKQ
jgi:hypothetical protein